MKPPVVARVKVDGHGFAAVVVGTFGVPFRGQVDGVVAFEVHVGAGAVGRVFGVEGRHGDYAGGAVHLGENGEEGEEGEESEKEGGGGEVVHGWMVSGWGCRFEFE